GKTMKTLASTPSLSAEERIGAVDWSDVESKLMARGFARLGALLQIEECEAMRSLYAEGRYFRSRIDMARYRFGRGEYQYFAYPLPPLVADLRQALYPKLVNVANAWAGLFGSSDRFPLSLNRLLALCHQRGQPRPTPLLLHYRQDDFNCLHQDIYGEIAFPFQVVFFLSQPGRDYSGGEFLLAEQAP